MERIVFVNGKSVSSAYLNSVQEGSKFTGDSRTDYYANPTSEDEAGWEIGQRDAIKDWEIADPRVDQESAVGRTAHDGIVLGWDPEAQEPVRGVPATRPYGETGLAVTVEAGSIVGRNGHTLSWPRQVAVVNRGPGLVSYIYVLEGESPLTVSVGSELPSVTEPHVPLAKITLDSTGDGLATDPSTGEVVGTGYVDLRPNTFVGNLNTYPQSLVNTPIQSSDYTVEPWQRAILDTSNGSIVLTLPESPTDSDRVAVVDIMGTFDRFPLVIRTNPVSTELLNNSLDDWIVNVKDAHLELFYHAATGQWKFEEAPGAGCSPVLGTFLSCGGQEYIGDRTAAECPDGQPLPARYPDASAGTYQFEPSIADPTLGKCYRSYNETVALYANGTGGLITVVNTPRCIRDASSVISTSSVTRNTLYVDQSIGDDSIDNRGIDRNRPFRTIERAIIEGARESRRSGQSNDRYDKIVIDVAAGDYYVDNSPGSLSTLSITDEAGLIQRIETGLTILTVEEGDRNVSFTVDVGNTISTQPPLALNLGRVLYSESGGVGNVARIEKQAGSEWLVTLEYVNGVFSLGDELFYDNLAVVNPSEGGLIIPRGISIDGSDLRKVRIRPMYVPELDPVQSNPQTNRTSIFKVTGGTYVSLMTFTDNQQYSRSHNTVTSISFASQDEIYGSGSETSYYVRLNDLFKEVDGWGSDGLEPITAETAIVAPIASSKANRDQDIEENQTGTQLADGRPDAPIAYPGATQIRDSDGAIVPLPDVNSTRSASPYVFNCSVRSIFGLNGLWAEGSKVSGFKSMVTANFTQVSLQTDPNCFAEGTYFEDPSTEAESGSGKRYKDCPNDLFKYRHFGMRGSNDGSIQIVSVFVIGNSDHFVSESGADLSITNSCSDFGDISLRGMGYKTQSFSQDEKASEPGYTGTRITKIIPPLPLSYSALSDGRPPTLEDNEINTGYVIQYGKTLAYTVQNKTGADEAPATMRIYIQNSNIASPLTPENVPSASEMSFGQFSYTNKIGESSWELAGGPSRPNRKRIYVTGFDEDGNSILYTGDLTIPDPGSAGFDSLDDRSKIFVWDPAPQDYDEEGNLITGSGSWYIPVVWGEIIDEETDLDNDGYLLKSFPYAFRYKLMEEPVGQDAIFAGIDFIFDRSNVKTVRAIDKRRDDERVYRVVLDGFLKDQGLRRPQPYYVLEKQLGVSGYPLNTGGVLGTDPVTVTRVRTYDEVFRPGKQDVQFPGQYVTYLTLGSQARLVFSNDFIPDRDDDYPELTADPIDSPTKVALAAMEARTGVYFSEPLEPSVDQIEVKVSSGASATGIKIGLRRPSVIRASGHTWEWTGYLNYDTSFPTFQGEPLDTQYALGKIIAEENGGRVYATGMNEEGNYYLGTTVFDLRSGEQFAIPLVSDGEQASPTNQVLSSVIIRDTLFMQDNSSMVFGSDTDIFVSDTTRIRSLTSGEIVAKANPAALYATKERAGLVQLAAPDVIANAKSPAMAGISDKVVITALDLANDVVTPERLSEGGPDWNTDGDLTVEGVVYAEGGLCSVHAATGSATNTPESSPGDGYNIVKLTNAESVDDSIWVQFTGLNPGGANGNQSSCWIGANYNSDYSSDLSLYVGKRGTGYTAAPYQAARSISLSQDVIRLYTSASGGGNVPSLETLALTQTSATVGAQNLSQVTVTAKGASGTDIDGQHLVLRGGRPTGSGSCGQVRIFPSTQDSASSGTALRSNSERGLILSFKETEWGANSALGITTLVLGRDNEQGNLSGYTDGARSILTIGGCIDQDVSGIEIVGQSNVSNAPQGFIRFFGRKTSPSNLPVKQAAIRSSSVGVSDSDGNLDFWVVKDGVEYKALSLKHDSTLQSISPTGEVTVLGSGSVKAWGKFEADTSPVIISDSYNVAGITREEGDLYPFQPGGNFIRWQIAFTNPMENANYAVLFHMNDLDYDNYRVLYDFTTTGFSIYLSSYATPLNSVDIHFAVLSN